MFEMGACPETRVYRPKNVRLGSDEVLRKRGDELNWSKSKMFPQILPKRKKGSQLAGHVLYGGAELFSSSAV